MTEYDIHRIKWGNWEPCSIKALAYDKHSNLLAIGRENGEIEICRPNEKFYIQLRIPGQKQFDLKQLVWSASPPSSQSINSKSSAQEFSSRVVESSSQSAESSSHHSRLFGISFRGFIFEIDFKNLKYTNISDCYGGSAWCLAMNPKNTVERGSGSGATGGSDTSDISNSSLAVGCEDGTVRIFNYNHHSYSTGSTHRSGSSGTSGDHLEYVRAVPSVGSRVLSVAFHPREHKLFYGCADGTIRCVDERTGSSIHRMAGDFGRGLSTYIWSLLVLSDSTVISGDNKGQIQIWDGDIGVLSQSFQQHTADVLVLSAGLNENQIYASGVDSKVTCFQRVSSGGSGSDSEWHYTTSHRPHSHDVLALCACIPTSVTATTAVSGTSGGSDTQSLTHTALLVSGGMDCKLCTYALSDFDSTRPAWILPVPATGLVSVATDYSLVAVRHRECIDLWGVTLHTTDTSTSTNTATTTTNSVTSNDTAGTTTAAMDMDRFVLKLRVNLKGNDCVYKHCLSPDGRWLSVTQAYTGTRLWYVSIDSHTAAVSVVAVTVPVRVAGSLCHSLSFSADSTRLIAVSSSGHICILALHPPTTTYATTATTAVSKTKKSKLKTTTTNSNGTNNDMNNLTAATSGASCTEAVHIYHTVSVEEYLAECSHTGTTGGSDSSHTGDTLCYVVGAVTLSSDGRYLALSDCSSHGVVYVYDVDTGRLHWRLPRLSHTHAVTAMQFSLPTTGSTTTTSTAGATGKKATKNNTTATQTVAIIKSYQNTDYNDSSLIVCYSNNYFQLYDVDRCLTAEWSKINNFSKFPTSLLDKPHVIESIFFHPKMAHFLVLYSKNMTIFLDVSDTQKCVVDTPTIVRMHENHSYKKPKLTSTTTTTGSGNSNSNNNNGNGNKEVVIVEKYRGVIHMGFLSHTSSASSTSNSSNSSNNNNSASTSLVVIENPWMRVLERLPDALTRKRYAS